MGLMNRILNTLFREYFNYKNQNFSDVSREIEKNPDHKKIFKDILELTNKIMISNKNISFQKTRYIINILILNY